MSNFKKFEKTNQKTEDRITITRSNSFGFPTKFYTDNGIGEFKYVVLFFDGDDKSIGIQFTNNDDEKHKFSIAKSSQGYGGGISATSFFKSYEIDTGKYRGRYHWKKELIEGIGELFIINLNEKEEKSAAQSMSQ